MYKICVVGLGYVGLPLAIEFAKYYDAVGFDIDKEKVEELKKGIDRTREVDVEQLKKSKIELTYDEKKIKECNFIVVAVPTPITQEKIPDLRFLGSASEIVGRNLSKDSIVVYESTVYPGVTENICAPILEEFSGFKCGKDFKVGYSPERINPGDKEHTIDKIVKVVSAMDEDSLNIVDEVYSQIVKVGTYRAKDIGTAEAAKVIENVQRDINIALMNELSVAFEKIGLDTNEVIKAAATKWNFHEYHPGLVGGHCIGVDPYYLVYRLKQSGYLPQIILAGRQINEYMSQQVVNLTNKSLKEVSKKLNKSTIYLLGLTFKENVPDPRNSKVKNVINILKMVRANVLAYDPLLNDNDVKEIFGVENTRFEDVEKVDAVILATPHNEFKKISLEDLSKKMYEPILIDVKSFFDREKAENLGFIYRCL